MQSDVQELVSVMEQAARAGFKEMRRILDSGISIEVNQKRDRTIVMNLDLASDRVMNAILSAKLPVVSEEVASSHGKLSNIGRFFLVDPLDGTSSCRRTIVNHGTQFPNGQMGFGPMVGLVDGGILKACTFLNMPDECLYTAVRGAGAWMCKAAEDLPLTERKRLQTGHQLPLVESVAIFYPGKHGEMPFIAYLREHEVLDSIYRFGGFANDCSRIARGFEQIGIQFSLKAWDLPAALLCEEAGLQVTMDPLGSWTPFAEWKVQEINPAMIADAECMAELRQHVERYKHS